VLLKYLSSALFSSVHCGNEVHYEDRFAEPSAEQSDLAMPESAYGHGGARCTGCVCGLAPQRQ